MTPCTWRKAYSYLCPGLIELLPTLLYTTRLLCTLQEQDGVFDKTQVEVDVVIPHIGQVYINLFLDVPL